MTANANLDAIGRRKVVLLVLLGFSVAVPLALLRYDEPTAGLATVKVLAKTGSLVGTVLLVWQMILGFRLVSTLFHDDLLWLIRLHRRLGAGAIVLIALHPIFIPIYYAWKFNRPVYLICGPRIMTKKLGKQLRHAQVPDEQIHHELFGF